MTSYQVMCSVTRPPEPTLLCRVTQFQDKVQRHINAVFQDHTLSGGPSGSRLTQRSGSDDRPEADPVQLRGDDLMLCALVAKTSASFSGTNENNNNNNNNNDTLQCILTQISLVSLSRREAGGFF